MPPRAANPVGPSSAASSAAVAAAAAAVASSAGATSFAAASVRGSSLGLPPSQPPPQPPPAEDDPYDFGSVNSAATAVCSVAPVGASAATRRRLAAASTAATFQQSVGAVGIARRGAEASAAAAAASCSESVGAETVGASGASAEESKLLHERLSEARRRTAEFDARKRQAMETVASERNECTEVQRRVEAAFDRLSTMLAGQPGVQPVEVEEDVDVAEISEDIAMLQQRLRAAKDVLRKHADVSATMRARRSLYEANGEQFPPPAPAARRPKSAAGRSGQEGGSARVLSTAERERSIAWLYEESRRKKAARETAAEEEREKALTANMRQRRLGKDEQVEVVKRFQGYAAKRLAREEAERTRLEEEANKMATKTKKVPLDGMLLRLADPYKLAQRKPLETVAQVGPTAADLLAPPSRLPKPRASSAKGRSKSPGSRIPKLAIYDTPDTPRTTAAAKLLEGKMLDEAEMEMLRDAASEPGTPRSKATAKLIEGKMLSEAEMTLLRDAAMGDNAASRYDAPQRHAEESAPPAEESAPPAQESAPPAQESAPPAREQGEQVELTVPEGYAAGDDLPVALPNGSQVVVTVPEGLGPGDEFIALIQADP